MQNKNMNKYLPGIKILVIHDIYPHLSCIKVVLNRLKQFSILEDPLDEEHALSIIKEKQPDVIVLDVEMADLRNLFFLQRIIKEYQCSVVISSSLKGDYPAVTIRALECGAVNYVIKPVSLSDVDRYFSELELKIKIAYRANIQPAYKKLLDGVNHHKNDSTESYNQNNIRFIKKRAIPKLIAIGASTGGPVALEKILRSLPEDAPPIVIAQHFPVGFSDHFAQRISRYTKVEVKQAVEGDVLKPGLVLMAPGGKNLRVVQQYKDLICTLDLPREPDPVQHYPSVDELFKSLNFLTKHEVIAVLLTGMGNDGALAIKSLHDRGVHTLVQDKASSLVFGMPKKAIELGAASEIVVIDKMAERMLAAAY